jgi:serine/threonine protein kinase
MRRGPELEPGEWLFDGRFQLVEILGREGFGRVWKAWDEKLTRAVALKVLFPHHLEERSKVERFFRGARKMAELQHQNIARVFESELLDEYGWHFFVMEYVDGLNLEQAVLHGEVETTEVIRIVLQVGEALEHAHRRGLIHRDVKPSNILLDAKRWPKLTDFDLVRGGDTTGFTATHAMVGTLSYAAPEALESGRDAGPAADIYSLASTVVFGLRGKALPQGYYRDPERAITELPVSEDIRRVLTQASA